MNIDYGSYAGKEIQRALRLAVEAVFAKNPHLKFEADYAKFSQTAAQDIIVRFNILHGFDTLGSISVSYDDYRGTRQWVLSVRHEGITKRRGEKGVKRTIGPKAAAATVLEYFKPQPVDEVAKQIISSARDRIGVLSYAALSKASALVTEKRQAFADAMYELSVMARDGVLRLSQEVMDTFKDPEVVTKLHTNCIMTRVAAQFYRKNGVVVNIERSGDMRVFKLDTIAVDTISSTYELAENFQEKLAMLKLCDADQPVESVGVRLSDGLFYLIDGATVTTC